MSLAIRKNIVLIILSDKTDSIAEGVANKFADKIDKYIEERNIDLSMFIEEYILGELKNLLDELENSITSLNKSLQNVTYLK